MAKQRYINTRFWDDSYISDLDPSEKLIFLYLLTNTATNIIGVYEIPLKRMAVDTGIDKEMVLKILKRFENDNKIIYSKGWVILINFLKHQNTKSPKIQAGIKAEIEKIPSELIPYIYGIDTISHLNLNLNLNLNSNLNSNNNAKKTNNKKNCESKDSLYQDTLNLIYDEHFKLHGNKLVITAKEGNQIKNIIKKASLQNKDNPLSIIKNKISILKQKIKKDKNGYWTLTPAKLLSGWNDLVNTEEKSQYEFITKGILDD